MSDRPAGFYLVEHNLGSRANARGLARWNGDDDWEILSTGSIVPDRYCKPLSNRLLTSDLELCDPTTGGTIPKDDTTEAVRYALILNRLSGIESSLDVELERAGDRGFTRGKEAAARHLEQLKDPDKPMDLDRARVISEVAQTIINSAKVEVDLVKAVKDSSPGSRFFDLQEESRELPKISAGNGNS